MTNGTSSDEAVAGTIYSLRAVLASIEAGDLHAEPDQVAYLRGAVASLDHVPDALDQAA